MDCRCRKALTALRAWKEVTSEALLTREGEGREARGEGRRARGPRTQYLIYLKCLLLSAAGYITDGTTDQGVVSV